MLIPVRSPLVPDAESDGEVGLPIKDLDNSAPERRIIMVTPSVLVGDPDLNLPLFVAFSW